MVVVGAQGLLTNYSGLTFDNGNLNLSGALEVTNIQGTGSLYLKPDLDDSRLFEIYNSAAPSGYTDIHFVGNADFNFFGDDTNYLKIDDYAQTVTLVGVNGVIVSSSLQVTGSVFTDKILGTGSLYLQPDQIDGRYFEIYNTGASDVHIKSSGGLSFFGDDTNYLKIDDYAQTATLVGVNGVFVSSSLNVTGSSTLNSTLEVKGATGLNSTLDVTGSAILKSTLQVDSTSELKGAVGMNSSLDVTGSAQFKSTINVDGEATLSSATVEDLTQDRIVTVGAGGSLIDSSGFTYNGTLFKIGNGQFEVDTNDGDIRTSGSLTVNGGQTINGNTTINGVLTVTGNTQLQANLYVSGNLEVLGSATEVHIQSQTIELDDNIIRLNAYSPFERYAGFEVIDSGSSGVSASLVWDSLNDYWMFVSASGQSSKLLGTTAGTYGSETSLTSGTIPKATGANTIGDSLLTDDGTTLSYNTNKFQVTSTNGNTLIAGNVTLSYSGGTDNGTKTSAIVFKNSSNVLGYVSTTVVTEVTDGLLGYKVSNGALVFSDLIDGGSY
jgi:cytoskeletal protein CcmA (bactofilin family)